MRDERDGRDGRDVRKEGGEEEDGKGDLIPSWQCDAAQQQPCAAVRRRSAHASHAQLCVTIIDTHACMHITPLRPSCPHIPQPSYPSLPHSLPHTLLTSHILLISLTVAAVTLHSPHLHHFHSISLLDS